VLGGKRLPRLPRWGFVESYVAACLQAGGADPATVAAETERWRERWCRLAVIDEPDRPEQVPPPGPSGSRGPTTRPVRRWVAVTAVAGVFLLGAGSGALLAGRWTGSPESGAASPRSPDDCESSAIPAGRDLLSTVGRGWWMNDPDLATLRADGDRLEATVPSGTPRPSDVIMIKSDVGLVRERHYTLAFTTVADRAATIGVRVQDKREPYLPSLNHDLSVGTSACRHVFRFTGAQDNPYAELLFQLGGLPDDLLLTVSDIDLVEENR
jgi:hypothetical protein